MNKKMIGLSAALSGVTLVLVSTAASAYVLQKSDGTGCSQDGDECKVYCDNEELAGSMYWNGSVWTDGVRSDEDPDVVASQIVAANGTACT
jgi:hypothetical protein